MQATVGAVVADRFRLVRELGRGAMGSVWLADHVALLVPCAVKFIHGRALDRPAARERFEREAKAAAALRSPNVVQILDYGQWEGVPYIAMEYLEGETLRARLERCGRIDPAQTVHIVAQIARALTRAHKVGIVHRDLKPENVFLERDGTDDEEVVKVLDFGVAKATGVVTALGEVKNSTKTGALLGTPAYMSPEQAHGAKGVDWRSDLWALGVIAYRCVVGNLPFYHELLVDLLLQICTQPLPVPSEHAPDLPAAFDSWWARVACREPEGRFQSAKELAQALGEALGVAANVGQSSHDEVADGHAAFDGAEPIAPAAAREDDSADWATTQAVSDRRKRGTSGVAPLIPQGVSASGHGEGTEPSAARSVSGPIGPAVGSEQQASASAGSESLPQLASSGTPGTLERGRATTLLALVAGGLVVAATAAWLGIRSGGQEPAEAQSPPRQPTASVESPNLESVAPEASDTPSPQSPLADSSDAGQAAAAREGDSSDVVTAPGSSTAPPSFGTPGSPTTERPTPPPPSPPRGTRSAPTAAPKPIDRVGF